MSGWNTFLAFTGMLREKYFKTAKNVKKKSQVRE